MGVVFLLQFSPADHNFKNMDQFNKLYIGPAGWHYKDWYGNVYPAAPSRTFKALDFLSTFVNTVEINSTFYKPANAFMARAWLTKTAHHPDFKFTAKLWQRFTHQRGSFSQAEVDTYKQGIDPLHDAQKLGAVLMQFPWSFKNSEENRGYLHRLFEAFNSYPLVIEVRHLSWDTDAFYAMLDAGKIGCAAIDQPVIGKSVAFKPVQTGDIGYIRLHGRNYKSWFPPANPANKKSSPSARYDYLYTSEEIDKISDTIKQVAGKAKETYVVQNNHPRGQAIANTAQIRASLGMAVNELPETMFSQYPFLSKIATPLKNSHLKK